MRCDWKWRFNSAAFEKMSSPGGWAGLITAKVVVENRAKRCDDHNLAFVMVGGRVVRNTRANDMSIAILSREDCTRVL